MDLRLTPTSLPTGARPAMAPKLQAGLTGNRPTGAVAGEPGFAGAFKSALQSVSQAQNHSSRLQREVQMENPKVSLEETMVAMQKAQIGFQSALHVRNRMVQAYTDIMNMTV